MKFGKTLEDALTGRNRNMGFNNTLYMPTITLKSLDMLLLFATHGVQSRYISRYMMLGSLQPSVACNLGISPYDVRISFPATAKRTNILHKISRQLVK